MFCTSASFSSIGTCCFSPFFWPWDIFGDEKLVIMSILATRNFFPHRLVSKLPSFCCTIWCLQGYVRRQRGDGLRWAGCGRSDNEGIGMGTVHSHDASLRVPLGFSLPVSGKNMTRQTLCRAVGNILVDVDIMTHVRSLILFSAFD